MTELDRQVAERVEAVRARIAAAGGGAGVEVVAVTKTFGVEHALAAVRAGCRWIGENYAQEVVAKWADRAAAGSVAAAPAWSIQFIGRLQSNKVRLLAGIVDLFATVDRPSLVTEIARRCPGGRVLVQVATADEPGKGGCPVEAVPGLVDDARAAGLQVDGLMTVGPTAGGVEAARPGFREVRRLCDRLQLHVCSMGMSDDLEVAVEEGSTQVRVGSALFGPRPANH